MRGDEGNNKGRIRAKWGKPIKTFACINKLIYEPMQ